MYTPTISQTVVSIDIKLTLVQRELHGFLNDQVYKLDKQFHVILSHLFRTSKRRKTDKLQ